MTATEPFDADRLDAWLEGNPFPTASLNGHSDHQVELVGAAQRFHADIGAAERGLPVPTRAIWEDVMQRTAGLQISPPVIAATNGNGGAKPLTAPHRARTSEPPPARGYWIATASLVVIAIVAIAAVALLANRPSNGGHDVPGLAASALTPNAGSSVIASPAADDQSNIPFTILDPTQIDCSEVVRRSNEEITALQANPGEFPERSYGPAAPVDPEAAAAVSVTDQYYNACRADWWTLVSPRVIAETRQTGSIGTLFPKLYLDQGMTLDDLPAFVQGLVAETGVSDPLDLIVPMDAFGEEASWTPVIDPNHARLFPDGRIGAPQSYLVHSSDIEADPTSLNTQFVFYIQDPTQDGKWVLDERLPICVGECDEYWDVFTNPATWAEVLKPIPGTTPEASPTADNERWLAHPDDMDCLRADPDPLADEPTITRAPMPLSDYLPFADASSQDQVAVATKTQQLIVPCDLGGEPLISDDFSYFDSPYGDPVTQQQLDTARALSETVATDDLMDYIVVADEPRPTNLDGDLYSFSRRTLLPDSIVLLPDGRLGGPLTAIVPSASQSRAAIADYIAERGQIETNFVIFERQGDSWVLDESITLCLGDCDDWWAMYQVTGEPTIATPEASPTADIARWLVPPSSVDCGTPVVNDLNSNEWSTDLVVDTDAYLPFSEPPADQQEAIAETALLAFSDCANSAMLSDDFAWTAGAPGVLPTADQIAAGQKISAALSDQDPANYLIVQPSDDPDYRGRIVLLPDDVVMLADGRLGAPIRFLATSEVDAELIRQMMGSGTFMPSFFYTFEQSGDTWLLDEMFLVCVGECDAFWNASANGTNLQGTPESLVVESSQTSPEYIDAWVSISSAYACPPATMDETSRNSWPTNLVIEPDNYLPFAPPSGIDRDNLSNVLLQITADCESDPSISPDFAWMPGPSVAIPTDDQIAAAKEISAALPDQDPDSYYVAAPLADIPPEQGSALLLPTDIVQLADGRLGVPARIMFASETDAQQMQDEAARLGGGGQFAMTVFFTFTASGDDWLMDEIFLICIGECDAAWDAMANGTNLQGTPESVGPDATPVTATDFPPIAADESKWLVDPESIACSRSIGGYDGTPSRTIRGNEGDFLPFAPAAEDQQAAIATHYQNLQGLCLSNIEDGLYFSDTFWTLPYPGTSGTEVTQRDVDIARAVSATVSTGNPLDFLIAEDAPYELIQPVVSHTVLLPSSVVMLPDGRFGGVLHIVVDANSPDDIAPWIAEHGIRGDAIVTAFVVYAPDGDGYVLDGSFPICVGGDCDAYWASYDIADGDIATPAASPAASIEQWLVDPATVTCPTSDTPDPNARTFDRWPTNLRIDPSSYLPFTTPPLAQQQDIAEVGVHIAAGCINATTLSPDFAWMPGPSVAMPSDDQIAAAQEISAALPEQDPAAYVIVRSDVALTSGSFSVMSPDDVVMLADRRLGVPLRHVVNSEEDKEQFLAEMGDGTYMLSAFYTFEQSGDDWLLDEMFLVCIGECDEAWEMMADESFYLATPAASPAVRISSNERYNPVRAEECTVADLTSEEVSAIVRDPGEEPERSYVPIGEAGPDDVAAAVATDRAWMACSIFGSIGQKTMLQTPWFTATGPEADILIGTVDNTEALIQERSFLSMWLGWQEPRYYVVSAGITNDELMTSLTSPSQTVPDPNNVMLLEDGRIAIGHLTIVASDAYELSADAESRQYFVITVHILALDPETGEWKVDEVIKLCGGDCDQLIANLREQEAIWLEQSGQEPATPEEATPASGS